MLRHEHERPDSHALSLACGSNRVENDAADAGIIEVRPPLMARKGELPGIADDVIVLDSLANFRAYSHGRIVTEPW